MIREWIHAVVWFQRHLRGRMPVPELAQILPLLNPADTVVDVGAHAGSWSVPLARRVNRGVVYAFEALPYYASVLKKLTALMRHGNVRIVNQAITATPQAVKMVWLDPAGRRITGLTHIAGANEDASGTVEVAGQPLDVALASSPGRVSFIKCDVEGAEFGVFLGAAQTIERHRPMVFAELIPEHLKRYGHSLDDVFGCFAARDYVAWDLKEGGRPQRLEKPADYVGHDVFFSPREVRLPWAA
jgi:FkbM family methyltransferase